MSMINPALLSRTLGQFPLSISTSLAFEGLFGIHEDNPTPKGQPAPWVGIEFLHINVRTLIRNCFTVMPSAQAYTCSPKEIAMVVAEEVSIIKGILKDRIQDPRFQYAFYIPKYDNLAEAFPDANLRESNTDKQKFYRHLEDAVIKRLIDEQALLYVEHEIISLKTRLGKGRALMLTHFPIDLLVARHQRFKLLESHTGRIKERYELTSKLKTAKDARIPFDIMTIQLFGDSGDMFKPADRKVREVTLKIADKYHWNETTTKDRVRETIKMGYEPHLYTYVSQLYRAPRV